ncbi:sulfatase [Gemmatimonadota bacterium]
MTSHEQERAPGMIPRREFTRRAGLATLSFALGGCASGLKIPEKKPNIILILIDDLGWKDVGFMGSRYYQTPNIDRLSREGMMFTDAYAAAPNCAPSRACLLTGMYTPRHGIYTVNSSERGDARHRKLIPTPNTTELAPGFITVVEALHDVGYISASIGKWHLGNDPGRGPLSQGFDLNIGGGESGHPPSHFSPYGLRTLPDGPEGEYLTDRLTDEAIRFIETSGEQPFFLFLTHYAVHTPVQAPDEITALYQDVPPSNGQNDPAYAAMIESVDTGIGRLLDALDTAGQTDNTVIIFCSDNGGHGGKTSMEPLRGSKGMLYEGGIRSPMIVRWPGQIEAGSSCSEPVIMVDFLPTILELAGGALPSGQPADGVSLVPLLKGRSEFDREAIFWHFPVYLEAYAGMQGEWRTTPVGAVRAGHWKLIEFFEDGQLELYNLLDDIGEKNDLSQALPERRDELHLLMRDWREKSGAPVPVALNPLYSPDT